MRAEDRSPRRDPAAHQSGLLNSPKLASKLTSAIAVSQARQGGPPRNPSRAEGQDEGQAAQVERGDPDLVPADRRDHSQPERFPMKVVPKTLGQRHSTIRYGSRLNG